MRPITVVALVVLAGALLWLAFGAAAVAVYHAVTR
jgi:hypothetical protein